MKKLILVAVLLFLGLSSNAQAAPQAMKKNTISYEIGMWQRGLAGISYHRNFSLNDYISTSVGGSAGLGMGWEEGGWLGLGSFERNTFIGGDASVNFGAGGVMLMLGAEAKYVNMYARTHYTGFAALPYAGVSTDLYNFTFQLRGGALLIGDDMEKVLPSVGLSFGYSF